MKTHEPSNLETEFVGSYQGGGGGGGIGIVSINQTGAFSDLKPQDLRQHHKQCAAKGQV